MHRLSHAADASRRGRPGIRAAIRCSRSSPVRRPGLSPNSCTGCHTDLSRDYMQRFVEETQSGILKRLTDAQAALESQYRRRRPGCWTRLQFVCKGRQSRRPQFLLRLDAARYRRARTGHRPVDRAFQRVDTSGRRPDRLRRVSRGSNTASGRPRRTPMPR